jgi:hypothetical protein
MTVESVDKFAVSTSDQLGCTYTSNKSAHVLRNSQLASNLPSAQKALLAILSELSTYTQPRSASERADQNMAGDCGGSMTSSLTESAINISFSNYCTEKVGGVQTTLNGSIDVTMNESGGKSVITASTPTPVRIKSTNPETSEPIDVTVDLKGGKLTETSEDCAILTATSVKVTDHISGDVFSATNISINTCDNGNITFSATVTFPDVGTTNIAGSVDEDGIGTITMTGSDGSVTTITSTDEGIYTVTANGTQTGVMDCSNIDVNTSVLDGFSLF